MLTERPWKVETVPALLAGLFGCIFFGSLLMQWLVPGGMSNASESQRFLGFVVSTVFFQGSGLLLIVGFLYLNQCSAVEAFGMKNGSLLRCAGLALAAFIVVLPLAWGLGQVSSRLIEALSGKPQLQMGVQIMQTRQAPMEVAFMCLSTMVLAPLVEEIFFRGILYHAVKRMGYPRMAIWSTTLLFAAIHGNLMTLPPLFMLAMVLTWLYEVTDNLLAPVLLHSLFNAANLATLLYMAELKQLLHRYFPTMT
ncbi:MAG: type II CAAX endopeptidase family protein [Verrucomicrobiota bacterium]